MKIAYYISAHGFGHGVRSCDIIRAFAARFPEAQIRVVSELPETFLRNRLPGTRLDIRARSFDVGMVQLDSIRVDVSATLKKIQKVLARRKNLLAEETEWLKCEGINLVQCDIPGMPLTAAAELGLPRLAISNFSWDWIYSPFAKSDARWQEVIEVFREDYRNANLLMRLPFAGDMSVFKNAIDVPLVASPGCEQRAAMARQYGLPDHKQWILMSFSSLELDKQALLNIANLSDHYAFLTVRPLEWHAPGFHAINRTDFSFSTVLASCDAVLTKPGFGVVSECIVNRKPICFADREDFIEYPILVRGIEENLAHAHIPSEELYRGHLAPYLESCLNTPAPPHPLPAGGDQTVVDIMWRAMNSDAAKCTVKPRPSS